MPHDTVDELYERMNDDMEVRQPELGPSDIQAYFKGKSIFMTGATGFMGKCFVEKVLRSCPDLKRLYVLVRQRKAVSQEEKMKRYFQNFIFDRVRSANPNFEEKVVTIKGDLQEDRLGISEEERQLLIDEVDVIVHSGATVKFDEIISVALRINVLATKQMLDLAMDCKHVQSFIYVSTAYSHCYQDDIEEKFYETPADLKTVHDMIAADEAAKSSGGLNEEAAKMLLGKWPNIYTFTKSIAEDLVRQYGERANFACAVYRPSIVSAALDEPAVGWIGNNNGPAYAFMGCALGALHAMYYVGNPMDLVPVDYSINALIAATYDLPERWKIEKRPVVYNFGSSQVNPARLFELFASLKKEAPNIGSMNTLWHIFMFFVTQKWQFYILHFFLHFIPAVLADTVLLVIGQKPRALQVFWFATKHLQKIMYFTNGAWKIHVPEMMKVCDRLNARDRSLFKFDIRTLCWDNFIVNYMRGARVYMLKEPLDNVVEAKKRYQRMRQLHYGAATVFYLVLAYYALRALHCLFSAVI